MRVGVSIYKSCKKPPDDCLWFQQKNTCSKAIIETFVKSVKYVQS